MTSRFGRTVRTAGFVIGVCLLAACQTKVQRPAPAAGAAVLRTDGSYFSDRVADAPAQRPGLRNAFRVYRDLEAAYISTTDEPEIFDQGSFRAYRELGSGGCLIDDVHLDCRFVQEEKAWAVCGEVLNDALSLSLTRVDPAKENPAQCPAEGRRLFRFVPQR